MAMKAVLGVLLVLQAFINHAQDTAAVIGDSLEYRLSPKDTVIDTALKKKANIVRKKKEILSSNYFIADLKPPVPNASRLRLMQRADHVFYIVLFLLLYLGVIKSYFSRYFSNMFRVFFNTSLRQDQLTEQLLQARAPSLLFNFLYFFTAGFFLYLLLNKLDVVPVERTLLLPWIILSLTIIYFLKYCWLLFLGWLSGSSRAFSSYAFIVFLSNKVMGVFLLPLLTMAALAESRLSDAVSWLALALSGFLLLVRYLKAFNMLSDKLAISSFHFILYLLSLEILPLALLWHAAEKYLFKNS